MTEPVSMEATLPAAASQVRLERGQSLGRYMVLGELGAGGMAVVYTAYDAELDRKVALKLVRAEGERRARVRREAQAMARLSHPNVAQVYDVGEHDDSVFIAMEQVTGRTLAEWLRAERRAWGAVRDVFVQAGRGLAAAHGAGLVHRDFKPDNVLIDDGGRVLVADFGLARPITGAADDPPGSPEADDAPVSLRSDLTHPGALVGTPRYMAPEQLARDAVDERADQFSFCVALYEALYAQAPFAGETLAELRAETLAGRVRPAPSGASVPAWLHGAVVRGLATRADDRHAKMDALLALLERDRRASGYRPVMALNVLAIGAIAAVAAVAVLGRHDPTCTGAERRLAGIWDALRARELEAAFRATSLPYAGASLAAVQKSLDDYAAAWAGMHVETCEASQVRHEQSAQVMDLRMACLDRRRDELRALVDHLAHADRDVVQRSVGAAQGLTPLAGCADVVALKAPLPEPVDPRLVDVRHRVSEARAALAAGRYRVGREEATAAATGAEAIGWPPLLAEALVLRGQTEDRLGDYSAAERSFADAVAAAEAGRDDAEKARALNGLIVATGVRGNRHDEALRYAAWADAVITRLGGDLGLAAARLDGLGQVLRAQGHYVEALAAHTRARSLWAKLRGPEHKDVAGSLTFMGSNARLAGRLAEGRAYSEAALAILERLLGPDHPDVASALLSTGNAFRAEARPEEALARYLRALDVRERTLGAGHPDVAAVLTNIGLVLYDRGDRASARPYYTRALAIQEAALGPNHPQVATTVNNLGRLEEADGHPAEALAAYRRAHDIWLAAFGPEHTDVALSLRNQAGALAVLGRDPEALALCDQAIAIYAKTHGEASPYVLDVVIVSIPIAARLPGGALSRVDRAVDILQRVGRDHDDLLAPLIKGAQKVLGEPGARKTLEKLHALAVAHDAGPERLDETAALVVKARR